MGGNRHLPCCKKSPQTPNNLLTCECPANNLPELLPLSDIIGCLQGVEVLVLDSARSGRVLSREVETCPEQNVLAFQAGHETKPCWQVLMSSCIKSRPWITRMKAACRCQSSFRQEPSPKKLCEPLMQLEPRSAGSPRSIPKLLSFCYQGHWLQLGGEPAFFGSFPQGVMSPSALFPFCGWEGSPTKRDYRKKKKKKKKKNIGYPAAASK